MIRAKRRSEHAPLKVESAGWVGFLLYLVLVYRLRRALDRPRGDS